MKFHGNNKDMFVSPNVDNDNLSSEKFFEKNSPTRQQQLQKCNLKNFPNEVCDDKRFNMEENSLIRAFKGIFTNSNIATKMADTVHPIFIFMSNVCLWQ